MRRGKEIAQGSHASMAFMARKIASPWYKIIWLKLTKRWLSDGQAQWLKNSYTKVALVVNSEEELRSLHRQAKAAGIESHFITDSGKTEFNGVPTPTAVAIGPDFVNKIDPITSHLKLY